MTWKHWVARSSHPHEPFRKFEDARFAWEILQQTFPELLSAVLMPNHLHMILPDGDLKKLTGILGAISRRLKIEKLWQPVPEPSLIPDPHHLKRQIRYVALNPCRKKLCTDPLQWIWSTHRDIVFQPKFSLIQSLGETERDFSKRFHNYVSSDPSVCVTGTSFPQVAVKREIPEESLGQILRASAAALRMHPLKIKSIGPLRLLFIHLAQRQGWKNPTALAEVCGLTSRGVRKILHKSMPQEIDAAILCLGDQRFTHFVPKSGTKPP